MFCWVFGGMITPALRAWLTSGSELLWSLLAVSGGTIWHARDRIWLCIQHPTCCTFWPYSVSFKGPISHTFKMTLTTLLLVPKNHYPSTTIHRTPPPFQSSPPFYVGHLNFAFKAQRTVLTWIYSLISFLYMPTLSQMMGHSSFSFSPSFLLSHCDLE